MHFNLVFEGGGAKGVVFAGAMQEFEKQGHTYGRLLGTSAGAITATLLAAGFSPQEMLVQVNEKLPDGSPRFGTFMDIAESITDEDWENSVLFKLFNQINWPFVPESAERKMDDFIFKQFMQMKIYRLLFTFLELGGLYAGRAFLEWLREKLDLNGRNLGQATLAQFYEHTGKDCFKHHRWRRPGLESSNRPQLPCGLGRAHVDEHSFCLARSALAAGMGRLSWPRHHRPRHC